MSSSWAHSGLMVLVEKMKSQDSDFRFMALNDLMAELSKETFLQTDDTTESSTVHQVLELMKDSNGEVKNMAVRCLGMLVPRIREKQMQSIIDQLIHYISSKHEELRDIASLALKTVTTEMPNLPNFAITAVNKLAPKLIHQIVDPASSHELLIDSLDILAEVITKFASSVSQQLPLQKSALESIVPAMRHARPTVRKRSLVVLGALGSCATSEIFTQLSVQLTKDFQSESIEIRKTAIQLVAIFARTCPRRLGRRLPEFMPQIITTTADDDDELRETCLHAIEAILLHCPAEVTPFVYSAVDIAKENINHDPNYAGLDDSDEEMDDANDDYNEDDDDDDLIDEDYSDDDDMSWKVRRASAKVLSAAFTSRPELLVQHVAALASVLTARFSEREESVRLEVLDTFLVLLKQTQLYGGGPEAIEVIGGSVAAGALKRKRQEIESQGLERGPRAKLLSLVPAIAKALQNEIISKSLSTRLKSFVVLRELVIVLHGGLDNHIKSLLSQTHKSLRGVESTSAGGANLKAEILSFFRVLFLTHSPKSFEDELPQLVPILSSSIEDKLHRNCTEAFLTCSQLITVLRPFAGGVSKLNRYKSYVLQIYTATVARLNRLDSDQEIKERGISCLGILLSHAGDDLVEQHPECFALLLNRLKNEVTRYATVKVIAQIASSPVCTGSHFDAFLQSCIAEVATLLRKSNRLVRLAAFDCLVTSLSHTSAKLSVESSNSILAEVQPLLSQSMDMNLLPPILKSVNLIIRNDPSTRQAVQESILPQIYTVIRLPLAQGPAMNSLLEFFKTYVEVNSPVAGQTVDELFAALEAAKSTVSGTHVYSTVAKCIGAIATISEKASTEVADRATKALDTSSARDTDIYFSLLLLGELGRFQDLPTRSGLLDRILQLYSADTEEVRMAAAFAVGNMAVGAVGVILPLIQDHISSPTDGKDSKPLLSLHALKELITHGSEEQLGLIAKQIWPVLFDACDTKEEGVRSIGAECLARLTLTDPSNYLALLHERLRSSSPSVRAIVIAAVRFTLSTDSSVTYDELLAPVLVDFLSLLRDPELDVRRNAVFALNSAAHNKPYLIRDHLATLLPMLYAETHVKEELLRKVSMGPFLVVTDDGLDLRKNAYETMYQLLDTCWSRLNMDDYLDCIIAGMGDSDDGIKTLCYLMIMKIVELRSPVLTSTLAVSLDDLAEPIGQTLKSKLKETATKQEIEKQAELQRFIYKTLVVISNNMNNLITPTNTPKFWAVLHEAKDSSTSLSGASSSAPGGLWREIQLSMASSSLA